MPSTCQSRVVNAPVEEVWSRLRNFHDLSWAPTVVTRCEAVGDKGPDELGAKRVLNDAFHETLVELDDAGHTLRYSIDEGPSPVSSTEVSNYRGLVRASPSPDGRGTLVEWSSAWEADNDAAVSFCSGIYNALLDELEQAFRDRDPAP